MSPSARSLVSIPLPPVPAPAERSLAAAAIEVTGLLVERHLATAPRHERGGAVAVTSEEVFGRLATLGHARAATAADLAADLAAACERLRVGALGRVASALALGDDELALLAVLAALELDDGVERMLTWVWQDFTRKRPDRGFLIELVGGPREEDRARARRALHPAAPLHALRLLEIEDDTAGARAAVRIAARVVDAMVGDERVAAELGGLAELLPAVELDELVLAPALAAAAPGLAMAGARTLLVGASGAGKATLAAAAATSAGRRALRVDLEGVLAEGEGRLGAVLAAVAREALLADVLVVAELGDAALTRRTATALARWLAELSAPACVTAPARPALLAAVGGELGELVVGTPDLEMRTLLWLRGLPHDLAIATETVRDIAARYACGAGAITRAAHQAAARARASGRRALDGRALAEAARGMFTHRLGALAELVPTGFSWDDLVLPPDVMAELREVVAFARIRPHLLERWGFAGKLPYGRGVSAILSGPPGTGKTMVAQLLADELGYELYRIDLSQVVNKYVGETEKNLGRLFAEAEGSHAILFFDEADALFAKRTEVKSSNDRYANLEVNYLLQRMESYDGVTLLATNLEQGLDEAFKRRVRFVVGLELPDAPTRATLWQSMFPAAVPLAPGIDWADLGRRYEMSGGYIKKAAVRAAALAAVRDTPLTLTDLHAAARAEYRGMGRII